MADPRIKWALDILDDEGIETAPLYYHYGFPILGGLAGFGSVALKNILNHRPYYSRGGRLIFGTLASALVATFVRDYAGVKTAEREAVFKDYLIKHPDLFPEPERKKYGDACVVYPWVIRR